MAKSVNKVILLGNTGKDPEVTFLPSGTAVAKFGLATSERFKDKGGEWQDRTEWHNVVAYVKKGNKLYVEGSLRTSSWDDKTSGQKRYKTEVIMNELSLLSGRSDSDGSSGSSARSNSAGFDQRAPANDDYASQVEITDDDVPF
jgi:single-strand DNA-binding protein